MIQSTAGGITIAVRVSPRAGRSGISGRREDALLVRLAAAPVDGAANDELIAVIASALGVQRRRVTIVTGGRSRSKRIEVLGIDLASAMARLAPLLS